jgi:Zn-finger nucleic acid-binding protein
MEKYGYMGLAAILLDRCEACSLVWLDADELKKMVLALAQTNYRTERGYQQEYRDQQLDIASVAAMQAGGVGIRSTQLAKLKAARTMANLLLGMLRR